MAALQELSCYFTCPETCLVISNMVTCFLPPKTALRGYPQLLSKLLLEANPVQKVQATQLFVSQLFSRTVRSVRIRNQLGKPAAPEHPWYSDVTRNA